MGCICCNQSAAGSIEATEHTIMTMQTSRSGVEMNWWETLSDKCRASKGDLEVAMASGLGGDTDLQTSRCSFCCP